MSYERDRKGNAKWRKGDSKAFTKSEWYLFGIRLFVWWWIALECAVCTSICKSLRWGRHLRWQIGATFQFISPTILSAVQLYVRCHWESFIILLLLCIRSHWKCAAFECAYGMVWIVYIRTLEGQTDALWFIHFWRDCFFFIFCGNKGFKTDNQPRSKLNKKFNLNKWYRSRSTQHPHSKI